VLLERIRASGRHRCSVGLAMDDLEALVIQVTEVVQVCRGCTVDASPEVLDAIRTTADALAGAAAEAVPS
jgi:hypothetical protein